MGLAAAWLNGAQIGYRCIDCAAAYQNELEIGVALREIVASGFIRREDLFIISKLPPECHNMQDVRARLEVCVCGRLHRATPPRNPCASCSSAMSTCT